MMIVEDSCTILQILETGDAETSEEAAMDLMYRPPSERGARRAQTGRDDLAERVARAVREDGVVEAPGGLSLLRHSWPTPKDHGVSSPAFCVIAQGSKEVLLGDDCYRYDANCYLITAA
jgi:AraC-type transcriptional regulator